MIFRLPKFSMACFLKRYRNDRLYTFLIFGMRGELYMDTLSLLYE